MSAHRVTAFACVALACLGGSAVNGPLFATVQTVVPARLRAISIALIYFFANLVGMGLGPLATGALSDALRSWAGNESLRYAALALSPGYFWGAWHLWLASKTVTHDVDAARPIILPSCS
jgi:MFS family permease